MANYTTDQFRSIFQNKFNREAWKAIVVDIFGAHKVRSDNERFTDPDEPETGFYMGVIDTPDHYRVGLFYYKINTGSVAHKKVGLRNLVKRFINQNWGEFDAAIVVFDDGKEWRLSFVCDIKEEATAPKRFTFVFGEHDNFYRTAIERFSILQDQQPTFENIRKAFSVEALSDDFFDTYRELYADFVQYLTGKRYVKEGSKWIERELSKPNYQFQGTFEGDEKLVRDYVKKMFGRIVFLYFLQRKGWLNGNRQYMHDLFARSNKKDDFLDEVLEPLFFEVLNTDKPYRTSAAKALPGSENIPYLNGGLFAKDDVDDRTCVFPANYFHKLFNFLDSYNFTIDENDTDDAEIGIDPEMLGRIFENLLEDNKDKGAFYTPKEIVDYMCRESIIAYLLTGVPERSHELIRSFVETFDASELNAEQRHYIRKKLQAVKICDPAIGSGAFPMGLVNILSKLYVAMKADTDTSKMKRHIMEQNIYGVDIERGAVDIARLRFWLAMIVEEKEPIPLPNLHFKIMQGNSLLECYEGTDLSDLTNVSAQRNIFDSEYSERETLASDLKLYYNTTDHAKRDRLFTEITNNVRRQLLDKGITLPKGEDPSANSDFFLWHTWFTDVFANGGFDIVIGNPPYISAPAQVANEVLNNQRANIIASKKFKSLFEKWDLYIPFVELGLQMIKTGGITSMIIPYPFSNQKYAKVCRQIILDQYNLSEVADLKEIKVFKNATVQNCILFVENKPQHNVVYISHADEDENKRTIYLKKDFIKPKEALVQNEKGVWDLTESSSSGKLHPELNVFGDFCYISVGMVLNADEKTAKGKFKKDDLISDSYDEVHSRKYIEAKDIKPYSISKVRYLEWDTYRCPNCLRRPTFRELYEQPKILINRLGQLQSTIDVDIHYLHSDSLFCAVPWAFLSSVYNKSISGSIKKFSTLSRQKMEELSNLVSIQYLCAILNSSYGKVLLTEQRGGDYHIYPDHIRNLPIPIAPQQIQQAISKLVDEIVLISDKSSDPYNKLKKSIDILVYKCYGLNYEDILRISSESPISREEYENFKV